MKRLIALLLSMLLVAMGPAPERSRWLQAVEGNDLPNVEIMAKRKFNLFQRDDEGRSGLLIAAEKGDLLMVEFLLSKKLDVDGRDMYGNTALHLAARLGYAKIVKALLHANANTRVYNKACQAPLDLAAGFLREKTYELIRAKMEAAPLPTDGTVEECGLNPAILAFKRLSPIMHRKALVIDSVDDYRIAFQSAAMLETAPQLGAKLVPELTALVTHSTPPGGEDLPELDRDVRDIAARALAKATNTYALSKATEKILVKIVEAGSCDVYKKRVCTEDTIKQCNKIRGRDGLKGLLADIRGGPAEVAEWPRTEDQETCYSCRYCQNTGVEHSFYAALEWFRQHPEHGNSAARALKRLRSDRLLPEAEHRLLKRRYLNASTTAE